MHHSWKEEEQSMVVDRLRTDLLNKLINARI
ncbi:transcriptional regulator, partial [Citrobacter freundii]